VKERQQKKYDRRIKPTIAGRQDVSNLSADSHFYVADQTVSCNDNKNNQH